MFNKNAKDVWENLHKNVLIYDLCNSSQRSFEENSALQIRGKTKVSALKEEGNSGLDKNIKVAISCASYLYAEIFYDLFSKMTNLDFLGTPSVESKYKTSYFSENQRDTLERVNLFEHSVGVFFNMNKICIKNNIPVHIKDILLFLALVHDFGKNGAIRANFTPTDGKEDVPHEKVSARFAKIFLTEYNERQKLEEFKIQTSDIEFIENTLSIHHTDVDKSQLHDLLKLLREADFKTREEELSRLGWNNK